MTIVFTRDLERGCEWCRKRIEDTDEALYITDHGTRWRCHAACAENWAANKRLEADDARKDIERLEQEAAGVSADPTRAAA